ncbi:uncharacterized protein [Phaenicophaeus curvirostris]|uniref:uncharacterized protein n=1 Tax=Phaenicophaeus curvirostris TaxID=33595 RepID=UPI0037F0B493
MMREPLRDPDPSPGRGGKRRGGALQASSVQSTMEPSHLSCTLAAEEEEGAHGETEAIAIQPKKPVRRMPLLQKTWQKSRRTALLFQSPQREPGRSVGDERAPAGSRPLPRERGEATWRCPPGQQRLGLSPLCGVGSGFLSSCARPGGRRGLVQTLCPGRAAATFAA